MTRPTAERPVLTLTQGTGPRRVTRGAPRAPVDRPYSGLSEDAAREYLTFLVEEARHALDRRRAMQVGARAPGRFDLSGLERHLAYHEWERARLEATVPPLRVLR